MDKLWAMQAFVAIAEHGSITAAAETLSTSTPSLVRTLAALERQLGVRLLNRTTRRQQLTDEGMEYLERSRHILGQISEADAAVSARRTAPEGRLVVTAPSLFGRLHVASTAIAFLERYPQVSIELLLLDRVVNLLEEGVDVAVRIAHLPDSSLVAVPVGEIQRVVCASPALLRRTGIPREPQDLANRPVVRFTTLGLRDEWEFQQGDRRRMVAVAGPFASNQADAAIDACLQGLGFGRFLSYQVQALLDAGKLKRVLQAFETEPLPVSLVYPHARLLSARVRVFVDWTSARLRTLLASNPQHAPRRRR
jgi:DNA-binding transcriptional LysR family regulator